MERVNSKENILIVEDSPTQREKLKYLLETYGHSVIDSENAESALEYLNNKDNIRPTIIISDIMRPGMDGYELCSKIKNDERFKDIPVILLTTLSEPEDVLKGLDSGADNFVIKPYNDDFLLSRIDYVVLNREFRRSHQTEMGLEIVFGGKKRYITSSRMQILDMLFSTYETIIQKNKELEKINRELREANEKVKTLSGLIPICAMCKKVRKDNGYWEQVERFIADHSNASFTHSYCPECASKLMKDFKK